MEKYIKALLASNNRAIIPQFGAFQALREEKVSISFNPYLNFDDDKLTNLIAADKGISVDEAKDLISLEVDDYNNTLEDNGKLTFEGIGVIEKQEDGSRFFVADENYTDEFTNSPSSSAAAEEAPLFVPAEDQSAQANTAPAAESNESSNEEKQNEPLQTVATPLPNPEPTKQEEGNGKKKWIIILIILLLLLLFGILYCFVINKDNCVYRLFCSPAQTEQKAEPVPAPVDTAVVKPDTAVVTPEPAKPTPAKQLEPTEARKLDKRYNVIVGSYKDEQAAIRRVKDLHSKGFADAFVGIHSNKNNTYFVAVIGAYNSVLKAESVQEEIVDGPYHIESWITNSGENE